MKRIKYFMTALMFLGLLLVPLHAMAKSDSKKKVVGSVTEAGTTIVRSEDQSQNKETKTVETKKAESKTETKEVVKTKPAAGKNNPVLSKATVSIEDDAEEDNIVIEETDSIVADTTVVEKNSVNLENQVIDSMLKNDFPEKSGFIADEDKKSGVVLGKKDASSLTSTAPQLKEESGLGGMLVNTVVMTIVLVLLIVGMAYVWRYLHGRTFGKMLGKSDKLKIVTEQIISPKSKLMVVDCYGKKYLVGATENNIQMLADIDLDAVVTAESETTENEATPDDLDDQSEEKNKEVSHDDSVTSVGFAQNILSQFSAKKEANLATTSSKMFVPLSQIADVETKHAKTLKTSERIKERLKDMKRLA